MRLGCQEQSRILNINGTNKNAFEYLPESQNNWLGSNFLLLIYYV